MAGTDDSAAKDAAAKDAAAYAANWLTILMFDLLLGLLVTAGGVASIVAFNVAVGAVLLAAGAGYAALVGARARRWRRLRLRLRLRRATDTT